MMSSAHFVDSIGNSFRLAIYPLAFFVIALMLLKLWSPGFSKFAFLFYLFNEKSTIVLIAFLGVNLDGYMRFWRNPRRRLCRSTNFIPTYNVIAPFCGPQKKNSLEVLMAL